MNPNLFYLVFLLQVLLLSVFLPRRQVALMKNMMNQYPPAEYPRLYPQPEPHYQASRRSFLHISYLIAAAGLGLLGWMIFGTRDSGWDQQIVTGYYLLQFVPWFRLDLSALREYRLMRMLNRESKRSAGLKRRRLFEAVSPLLVYAAIGMYVIFCLFIVWMTRFDYEWFGGYLNVVILTVVNAIGIFITWRQLHGKRVDPHESEADRLIRAGNTIRILLLTSIALSLYAMLSVSMRALGLDAWQPLALSVYFQVLVLFTLRNYRFERQDYDVYRPKMEGS
ncbi:MAG TPA: hypothetical protein VJ984_06575 [Xanthomonadales bacterium]|nr:hypothetical protein [Xanthomonadales bacterium]